MHVTVVITSYNYGRYLAGCLQSVLAQVGQPFEVVVVDDGSTDETPRAIEPFLTDGRVRYHRQDNRGQAAAKNVGASLGDGELIAFLDADDEWAPRKLAMQVPLFQDPAVGVVYSAIDLMDGSGRRLAFEGPVHYWRYRRGYVTGWLAFDNFVPFSSSVVRRGLFEAHGGFDETLRMGIDWDLWLRLSLVTEFDFAPDRAVRYRVGHTGQMSKDWDGRVAAADTIFERFLERHPEALTASERRRVQFYNACSRARGYRHVNLRRSTALLCRALRLAPWSPTPYLALLRNAQVFVQRLANAA